MAGHYQYDDFGAHDEGLGGVLGGIPPLAPEEG